MLALTPEQKILIVDKLESLYDTAGQTQAYYSSWMFWYAAGSLIQGSPERFLAFLEKKIAEYKTNPPPRFTSYRQSNNQGWLGQIPFPPTDLDDFPNEVLTLFLDPNNRNIGHLEVEPDFDQLEKVFEIAENPVIKIIAANRVAADPEVIGKLVDDLVKNEKKRTFQTIQIAAAWYAREGEHKKAINILTEALTFPLSKPQRRSVDQAIVFSSSQLNQKDPELKPAFDAARAAAIRLTHGRLSSSQRNLLLTSMADLGLEAEVARQEKKQEALANVASTVSSSRSSYRPSRYQIEEFMKRGKRDQAIREGYRQLQPAASDLISNPQSNWSYQRRDILRVLSRFRILDDVYHRFEEENKGNSRPRALEYAGASVLLNDHEKAKQTLESLNTEENQSSTRQNVQALLAYLYADESPEKAMKLAATLRERELGTFLALILKKLNGNQTDIDNRLGLIENALLTLDAVPEKSPCDGVGTVSFSPICNDPGLGKM